MPYANRERLKENWNHPAKQKIIANFSRFLESQGTNPEQYLQQFNGISTSQSITATKAARKVWGMDAWNQMQHIHFRPVSLWLHSDTAIEQWVGICRKFQKKWVFELVGKTPIPVQTPQTVILSIERQLTPRQYELYKTFKNSKNVFKDMWDSPICQNISIASIKYVMDIIKQVQDIKAEIREKRNSE